MKVIKITKEEWYSLYSAFENYHCNETIFKKSNGNLVAFLYDNGNGKEPYKIIQGDKE